MSDSIDLEPARPFDASRLELMRMPVGLSLDEYFRRICEVASATLNVNRVGIWFFTASRAALRCANLFESETGVHSAGVTLQVADFPSYFATLERRRSIPAEAAEDDPRTRQLADRYLRPLGILALLDAPIYRDGRVVGVVCHELTESHRTWTAEERDFAASIADQVTLRLKSADLAEARRALLQTDEALFSIERTDSMARIVTEAAHDFKNVLTVVIGFANELVNADGMPPHAREMASHILKSGERGAELVRQMTAYGHSEADGPEVFAIGDIVLRMQPLLRTAVGSQCRMNIEVEAHSGRLFLDPSQMERVVYNLVTNARDAMPDGGEIRVRTTIENWEGDERTRRAFAVLIVSDDGVGMEESVRTKAFEPFFTTKPRGQGTGLGLAIVQRIVERAGGFVRIESEPGRGTSVRAFFPFVSRG